MNIYVDESGDLGWSFTMPYRKGGSSRHLTISAVCIAPEKSHLLKRAVKSLYVRLKVNPSNELKWVDVPEIDRIWFAEKIEQLKVSLRDELTLISMTVKKQNVMPHIQKDPNKLYNYMLNLMLTDDMAKHPVVNLIPDPRSVKVSSGSSMHDYLQTQLWFEKNASTKLNTTPIDSKSCYGLQFADYFAGMVQGHFEDNKSSCYNKIAHISRIIRLYF